MTIKWANAAVNQLTGNASTSTFLNSGLIKIYTIGSGVPALNVAPSGTLLVTLTLNATPFSAAASGIATANGITAGTAVATGTAAVFAIYKSDGTTLVATGTVGTSGADMTIDNTSIASGAAVSCTGFTLPGGS